MSSVLPQGLRLLDGDWCSGAYLRTYTMGLLVRDCRTCDWSLAKWQAQQHTATAANDTIHSAEMYVVAAHHQPVASNSAASLGFGHSLAAAEAAIDPQHATSTLAWGVAWSVQELCACSLPSSG